MENHIMVGEWGYAIDTDAERAEALRAMGEAGLTETIIYNGDFEDDSSYPSENMLTVKGEVFKFPKCTVRCPGCQSYALREGETLCFSCKEL